jgi:hypothetical protein
MLSCVRWPLLFLWLFVVSSVHAAHVNLVLDNSNRLVLSPSIGPLKGSSPSIHPDHSPFSSTLSRVTAIGVFCFSSGGSYLEIPNLNLTLCSARPDSNCTVSFFNSQKSVVRTQPVIFQNGLSCLFHGFGGLSLCVRFLFQPLEW